jgi:hypothetical protein
VSIIRYVRHVCVGVRACTGWAPEVYALIGRQDVAATAAAQLLRTHTTKGTTHTTTSSLQSGLTPACLDPFRSNNPLQPHGPAALTLAAPPLQPHTPRLGHGGQDQAMRTFRGVSAQCTGTTGPALDLYGPEAHTAELCCPATQHGRRTYTHWCVNPCNEL